MLDLGLEDGDLLFDLLLELGLPGPGVVLDELGDVDNGLRAGQLDLVVLVGQLVQDVLGHLECKNNRVKLTEVLYEAVSKGLIRNSHERSRWKAGRTKQT